MCVKALCYCIYVLYTILIFNFNKSTKLNTAIFYISKFEANINRSNTSLLGVCFDSKEHFQEYFLKKPPVVLSSTQEPMVVENDNSKGDGDKNATSDTASDPNKASGSESTSSRENNRGTGSSKTELEESSYNKPREDLLYL